MVRSRDAILGTFIVDGATSSPAALDYVAAFKAKLEHSIDSPNANAISCLLCHFPQHMMMTAQAEVSSDDAIQHMQALAQLGTQTVIMSTDLHTAVNGPWPPTPSL